MMNKAIVVTSAVVLCTLLFGCGRAADNQPGNQGAAAGTVLPGDIAGPEVQINMPRRIQNSPPIQSAYANGGIRIYSHSSAWRGRQVTVFYVPPQNVVVRGGQQLLASTAGLQPIASTTIAPDGSWQVLWHLNGHPLPGAETYILVRTDQGQFGLARIQQQRRIP